MDVIGHQHISMCGDMITATRIPQTIKIEHIVWLGVEAGVAIVAALDYMAGYSRHTGSRFSRHGKFLLPLLKLIPRPAAIKNLMDRLAMCK
jgi:hypothetical protein